jgi:hypothetical protein
LPGGSSPRNRLVRGSGTRRNAPLEPEIPVRSLVWIAAGLCMAAPLGAQERPTEQAQERVHVVRPGDTLWDIARTYLQDPFMWPELFRLNTDVVQNPARIYPTERIRLPGAREALYAYADDTGWADEFSRTVFFPRERDDSNADMHRVRPAGTANIPVLTPGDFNRAGFIARDREVRALGEVAERIFPSVVPIELPPQIQVYDRVLVAMRSPDALRVGDRVAFYRPDRVVNRHGRIFLPTGIATVAAVDGRTATVVVIQLFDSMSTGDLALPLERFPVPAGVQPIPDVGMEATIVAFQNRAALYPTQQVAYLSVGEVSGVRPGDEFSVYLPRQRRRWGDRPEVEVARLQVVRVNGRTSAARIVGITYPALEPGLAVRRVARMP